MARIHHFAVAQRYAKALFELAVQAKAESAVEKDLRVLAETAAQEKTFMDFLENPLLGRSAKAAALQAVLEKGRAHALTGQFMARLALNNRLSTLPHVACAFFSLLAEQRGELRVEVTSARPLEGKDADMLATVLGKAYAKNIRLEARVNAQLIGGLVLKIGDIVVDYSVAGQFAQLAAKLKHAPIPQAA